MLFMIDGRDKRGHEHIRLETRQAHLDYLAHFADQVLVGGPTQTDDGAHMTGSLLIIDFPNREQAEAFAANDPYAKAGLFESVAIRRFRKVLPKDA